MSRWKHVLSEAVIGLGRNLLMSLAVILSVAVSLTLLGGAELLRRQVDLVAGDWQGRIEVSIFLCDGTRCPAITPEQQAELKAELETEPLVKEVFFESKQEAYEVFVERFADQPALVESVNPDTLPASFRVKLTDPERFAVIGDRFSAFPGVEEIVDQRKVLEGFLGLLRGVQAGALLVALIQLVAGAVLVANTIRVAAYARREQTAVMKLVGASNWYIRLPFVLEGMVEGLLGAGVAIALMHGAYPLYSRWIGGLVTFAPIISREEVWAVSFIVVALGVVMAGLSSLASLQRSLDV